MSTPITSQLVGFVTQCRRKAFFILNGTVDPDTHDYEAIIEQRASDNRKQLLDSMTTDQELLSIPVDRMIRRL